jgi:Pyruvate/2-oxoacid:ferredoxin oxidoreductase delta subunit
MRCAPVSDNGCPSNPVHSRVAVGDRCTGCGACLLTCPEHALRPVPGGLLVRAERCTGCLECIEVCPADAISEV